MSARRLFRIAALAALFLVPAGAARVTPLGWPGAEAAEPSCPVERGSCPRCPAPVRRAPDACTPCAAAPEGVVASRSAVRRPRPVAAVSADPARGPRRVAAAGASATLHRRHEVAGASPPVHLLLATLRN